MSSVSNLLARLRLIQIALTHRFIWTDLVKMVQSFGFELREIKGNTHPLQLTANLGGNLAARPDFSVARNSAAHFRTTDVWSWNSEPSVSEFLGELAARQGPRTVVELGCYLGWTSSHLILGMRMGNQAGKLWCLDSNAKYLEATRQNLARLGLGDGVQFVAGLSLDPAVLQQLPAEIDLIFLDTSHDYEQTRREISTYASRLVPGGMLVLHDSISLPGVRKAVSEVWEQFETTTFATEYGNGISVLRRPIKC